MDHVDTMFKGDANDIVLGEIGSHGREPFAYLVGFIRLQLDRVV